MIRDHLTPLQCRRTVSCCASSPSVLVGAPCRQWFVAVTAGHLPNHWPVRSTALEFFLPTALRASAHQAFWLRVLSSWRLRITTKPLFVLQASTWAPAADQRCLCLPARPHAPWRLVGMGCV